MYNIWTPIVHPYLAKFIKLVTILFNTDRRWLHGLVKGVAAAVEHESVLSVLSCETVVDIGANRGQFALVARHCFPHAKVISFEPLPAPAEVFRRIFARDGNTVLHEVAIGTVNEKRMMHVSARDDSSSLLPFTIMQKQMFPGTNEVGTCIVQVALLDAVLSADDIKHKAMLKLDVQGYELEALKGCESLLSRFFYVYVECSFIELYEKQALAHEVIKFLDEYGFALSGIHNMQYDRNGKEIQADFLFSNLKYKGVPHDIIQRDCDIE